MTETEIKTKHGLILQGILAQGLQVAGFSYAQDYQYDATCEVPDFLIPDGIKPRILIEVHQTDVRNSLSMKVLHAFIAVFEGKAHFSPELVAINFVFGAPQDRFSASALKALGAIYDVSIYQNTV